MTIKPLFAIAFTLLLTLVCMMSIHAQGSPDAPLSSSATFGETHATLKVHSNGYFADTTELKLTNMDSMGTGTEFVLRSINESGLVISSNSDLVGNTTDNILTLEPDGELVLGGYAGDGTQQLATDNLGRLLESESIFAVRTNLNTPPVNVTFSAWTPVGPTKTFVKEFDHSIIQLEFSGIIDYTTSSAFGVTVRMQIDGATLHRWTEGGVNQNTAPDFTSCKSIYKNLPAGTYTIQLHARSLGGNATNVFLGPNGLTGNMWIEERL